MSHRLPTRPGSSRAAWVALVLACACAARPTPPPAEPNRSDARHFLSSQLVADFDQLWAFVRDHYCFFGEKRVAWERVRDRYRPQVIGATDGVAFLRVVNAVLDELYDPHTHAKMHLDGDRRLPGHDLWAELRDGRALIVDVRRPSRAHEAGVRAGDEVLAVDGVAVAEAIAARRPTTLTAPDPEADAWALRSVLSGRHGAARALRLRGSDGATRDVPIPTGGPQSEGETLVARTLDGNVGYIAIRSFGERDLVERFDRALEGMRATTGLVIDVRNNGGGNTAYARPIMGRFIESRMQYAWMTRRAGATMGPRWAEYVDPRGPWTYTQPVVVLVNHWSASMAEGFPMGMQGMHRARIVGTRMMGLGAGVSDVVLGWTQIPVQVSAEPVFHVDGTARWHLQPDVPVDLAAPTTDDDPILSAGLRTLAARGAATNTP